MHYLLPVAPLGLKEMFGGPITLTGTLTMTNQYRQVLRIDPGGAARTVLLPPEEVGMTFVIINIADAAETMTLKDDSNTNTIGTITQNQTGWYWCDGTAWQRVETRATVV